MKSVGGGAGPGLAPARPWSLRGLTRPTFRRMLVLSVAMPAFGLALAGVWEGSGVAADERADIGRAMATLQLQTLRTLELQEVVLTAVAAGVVGLGWDEIRTSPAVHELLVRLNAASPAVDTVGLVDPDGHIAAASEVAALHHVVDLSDRDFVMAFPAGGAGGATRLGYLGRPVISRVDARPQVHMSRPHVVAGRDDGGVTVAGFRPALFETMFAEITTTSTTEISLQRDDGVVLAQYQPHPPDAAAPGGLVEQRPVGSYPLRVVLRHDPTLLFGDLMRRMAFPALGAVATAVLLLLLTLRARRVLDVERDRLRLRTAVAEAEQRSAQQRAELEARLRQTEKTAALGQLAAGVAHDFNNLLQTVMIGAEALQRPRRQESEIASLAVLILKATDRGLALTARMLDFARRDDRDAGADDAAAASQICPAPQQALRNVIELLDRSLGAQYRLRLSTPAGSLPATRGGQSELETMLINLAINARDAMPLGGDIGFEADICGPPAALRAPRDSRFVRIVVCDTGAGMDAATLARAGEAFFTTKPRGKGTGLGLSMARGFAQRAGGMLELSSTPGQGTCVTVWLAAA